MGFELQPGEKALLQETVELVDNRRTYPATLTLTSQRAVLTWAKTPSTFLWAFVWIFALFAKAAAHARAQVRYQIRRDRFGSVEPGDGGMLVFHDTGEGYAHTAFAIKSRTPISLWQQRMERWAAGEDDLLERAADGAAALPSARIVDRR